MQQLPAERAGRHRDADRDDGEDVRRTSSRGRPRDARQPRDGRPAGVRGHRRRPGARRDPQPVRPRRPSATSSSGWPTRTPSSPTQVRALLFVFEDVLKLDDRTIQLVLKEIDSKDLALALRGASPTRSVERLMANMSTRAAEMLAEEIELMPPQRRKSSRRRSRRSSPPCAGSRRRARSSSPRGDRRRATTTTGRRDAAAIHLRAARARRPARRLGEIGAVAGGPIIARAEAEAGRIEAAARERGYAEGARPAAAAEPGARAGARGPRPGGRRGRGGSRRSVVAAAEAARGRARRRCSPRRSSRRARARPERSSARSSRVRFAASSTHDEARARGAPGGRRSDLLQDRGRHARSVGGPNDRVAGERRVAAAAASSAPRGRDRRAAGGRSSSAPPSCCGTRSRSGARHDAHALAPTSRRVHSTPTCCGTNGRVLTSLIGLVIEATGLRAEVGELLRDLGAAATSRRSPPRSSASATAARC